LRAELQTLPLPTSLDDEPLDADTLAELNSLPLLDATIREALRLWAPVSISMRTANEDTIIPLNTPVPDRKGALQTSIRYVKLEFPDVHQF
jgi:hypothetical protein